MKPIKTVLSITWRLGFILAYLSIVVYVLLVVCNELSQSVGCGRLF